MRTGSGFCSKTSTKVPEAFPGLPIWNGSHARCLEGILRSQKLTPAGVFLRLEGNGGSFMPDTPTKLGSTGRYVSLQKERIVSAEEAAATWLPISIWCRCIQRPETLLDEGWVLSNFGH